MIPRAPHGEKAHFELSPLVARLLGGGLGRRDTSRVTTSAEVANRTHRDRNEARQAT